MPHIRRHALVVAVFATLSPAWAAATVIDDFGSNQAALTLTYPPAGTSASNSVAGGMLGGERDLQIQLSSGVIAGNTLSSTVSSGFLSYSQDATIAGLGTLQWDGADGSATINPTGLGGVDLTAGGSQDALYLAVFFDDLPTDVTLKVYSDAGNISSYSTTLPGLIFSNTDFVIPFSAFSASAGAGADFSNVGAVEMTIGSSTTAPDVVIDQVDAVPRIGLTQSAAFVTDNHDIGLANPGDVIRYTVVVSNPGDAVEASADGVKLNGGIDANTTLVVGSVTTSQGTVTSGNAGGDSSVAVDIGTLADAGSATITYDVTVNDPLPLGTMQITAQSAASSSTLTQVLGNANAVPASTTPVTLQGFSVD